VNAGSVGITTAILSGGRLLLHRSMDLQPGPLALSGELPAEMFEGAESGLPVVDRHDTAGEWAAQQPLPEHGRNPYMDGIEDEAAVQNVDGLTAMRVPPAFGNGTAPSTSGAISRGTAGHFYGSDGNEPANILDSPYRSPTLDADLSAELHNAILVAPTSLGTLTDPAVARELLAEAGLRREGSENGASVAARAEVAAATRLPSAEDIAHAVSVSVAYFEDTLAMVPRKILSAGPLGAEALTAILHEYGVAQTDGLRVRELVESSALSADAVTPSVPRSTLAGVLGAVGG
jgi:hypothetical protein